MTRIVAVIPVKSFARAKTRLAGSLDAPPGIAIAEHIFVEEKPAYYDFADEAPRVTGAEVFERFTGPQDGQS